MRHSPNYYFISFTVANEVVEDDEEKWSLNIRSHRVENKQNVFLEKSFWLFSIVGFSVVMKWIRSNPHFDVGDISAQNRWNIHVLFTHADRQCPLCPEAMASDPWEFRGPPSMSDCSKISETKDNESSCLISKRGNAWSEFLICLRSLYLHTSTHIHVNGKKL